MRTFLSLLLLTIVCMAQTACIRYAAIKPKDENFIGRYLPENRNEKGIHSDSELIIYPHGRCKFIDFPIADYASFLPVHFNYYDLEGIWRLDNASGNWKLLIDLPSSEIVELRILNNRDFWTDEVIPYRICQEGEDLDDDSLIFDQTPLPSN